ncbi:MAG: 30S ribosomal protein S8 [Erysipelotrichaceae bacterium]|nr:30S ribosomal protein S8 [Erysipelotrichaceae bacterium]MBQ1810777.1 30S ribosomal protein S8 [Erysipelotrichaceae bacterium]MBR3150900.1 30S ribosomal protein S8 [Erysipelotrichaceae bacterium]MBR3167387.1 30S ribosomal protein S8 [Erysipelotrichaceae bacterium]MCR5300330.1 30S ribosomal protein S8 [Erysipelotrichaceae bacterium]
MNMTDPIADMLTRVRNALHADLPTVEVPASKVKCEIARILKEENYISGYTVEGETAKDKKIVITLKYAENNQKVISGIKRISKPGLRVYAKADAVPRVLNGLGIAIISTSHGLMTDRDARKKQLGGEVVAYVW